MTQTHSQTAGQMPKQPPKVRSIQFQLIAQLVASYVKSGLKIAFYSSLGLIGLALFYIVAGAAFWLCRLANDGLGLWR